MAHMQAAGGAVAGKNHFFHDVLLYFAGRRLALSVFAPQIHLIPLLALRATSPGRGSLSKGEALAMRKTFRFYQGLPL